MSKSRRQYTDAFKADAVRRHLSDKVPVSDLAAELDVQPSLIHLWVKQVLDQAEKAMRKVCDQVPLLIAGSHSLTLGCSPSLRAWPLRAIS